MLNVTLAVVCWLPCLAAAAPPPPYQMSAGETYGEKLLKVKTGSVTNLVPDAKSSYNIKAKFSTLGLDLGPIGHDTRVDIVLGSLEFHAKLGDDPKYVPGAKKATFVASVPDANGKPVSTRVITFSWTTKGITVSVRGATRPLIDGADSALKASGYSGDPSGTFADAISGTIIFGQAQFVFRSLDSIAKVKTIIGRLADGSPRPLSNVRFGAKGAGEYALTPVRTDAKNIQIVDTEVIGPTNGGNLTIPSGPLAGTRVTVPPGAVDGDTEFSLGTASFPMAPRSGSFAGQGLSITTNGTTTFEEPIEVQVPIPQDPSQIAVPYYVAEDGFLEPCQIVDFDPQEGTMTFETFHASPFLWIQAIVSIAEGNEISTVYLPLADGFQIVNYGSVYNPGGECFGFTAFAQWYFRILGGGLFDKYMDDIVIGEGPETVKGQQVIVTRAHTSLSRLWNSYVPQVQDGLSINGTQTFASIKNVLDNTSRPAILYLDDSSTDAGSHAAHAVLAYDYNTSAGTLKINDPNYPGQARNAFLATGNLTYDTYRKVRLIGDGSFQKEPLYNIYRDAEAGFAGNGAAQIDITSHADGDTVTSRTVTVSGRITSGQVLVEKLDVILNGTTLYRADVSSSGYFSLPISLVSGENNLTFVTKGYDSDDALIEVPNTSLLPFKLLFDGAATILVTLSWNTDDTDLDLYVIDPTGDYSAYYRRTTADGGELDYDDTNGYGPEHWTLLSTNTVRWDGEYRVRVHYYSDHRSGPTLPTRWTATILLYEGTSRAATYTYTGVLGFDNSGNTGPTGTGADWADIAFVIPTEATPSGTSLSVQSATFEPPAKITAPVPSPEKRLKPGKP